MIKLKLDIYIVDAFTKDQFKGNSAAVIPVKQWPTDTLMQNIAMENNLSETAFIMHLNTNKFAIRWFSPLTEIDFCGHATLAAAYVLFFELNYKDNIEFATVEVGPLYVSLRDDAQIEMSFPNQCPTVVDNVPDTLLTGLSKTPVSVLKNRQAYFAIYEHEADISEITYQPDLLKQLYPFDVVISSPGTDYDFVSRYFWPASGGLEDSVTGSVHAGLAPYWATILNKNRLIAYQASQRGGILHCVVDANRVFVSGTARLYLQGSIYV